MGQLAWIATDRMVSRRSSAAPTVGPPVSSPLDSLPLAPTRATTSAQPPQFYHDFVFHSNQGRIDMGSIHSAASSLSPPSAGILPTPPVATAQPPPLQPDDLRRRLDPSRPTAIPELRLPPRQLAPSSRLPCRLTPLCQRHTPPPQKSWTFLQFHCAPQPPPRPSAANATSAAPPSSGTQRNSPPTSSRSSESPTWSLPWRYNTDMNCYIL